MILKKYTILYWEYKKIYTIDLDKELKNETKIDITVDLINNQVTDFQIDGQYMTLESYEFDTNTHLEFQFEVHIPKYEDIKKMAYDCAAIIQEEEMQQEFEAYFEEKYNGINSLFVEKTIHSKGDLKKFKITNLLSIANRKNIFDFIEKADANDLKSYFDEFTKDIKFDMESYNILSKFIEYFDKKYKDEEKIIYEKKLHDKQEVKEILYNNLDFLISLKQQSVDENQITNETVRKKLADDERELELYFDEYTSNYITEIQKNLTQDKSQATENDKRPSLLKRLKKKKDYIQSI